MRRENPLWGAPKIRGELLKLGVEISGSSVSKYLVRRIRITFADLEDISTEPCQQFSLCRFLRGSYDPVPSSLSLPGAGPQASPHSALLSHLTRSACTVPSKDIAGCIHARYNKTLQTSHATPQRITNLTEPSHWFHI